MKFKVGDRVECLNDNGTPFTQGQVYTINGVSIDDGFVSLKEDQKERFVCAGWLFDRFKLIKRATNNKGKELKRD